MSKSMILQHVTRDHLCDSSIAMVDCRPYHAGMWSKCVGYSTRNTKAPPIHPNHTCSLHHFPPSQLRLGLGLLQDGVELRRLHDIALDLELARHE